MTTCPQQLTAGTYHPPIGISQSLSHCAIIKNVDFYLETDASAYGLGAVLRGANGHEWSSKNIEIEDIETSSAHRELLAIEFGILTFSKRLHGRSIIIRCDNLSVVQILRSMRSKKANLQEIAERVKRLICCNSIVWQIEWIPRAENELADWASRQIDFDNWSISDVAAREVQLEMGSCGVDMFADSDNAKCSKWVSRCPRHGATATDAFGVEAEELWSCEFLWLVPPIHLIARVVDKLKSSRGKAILGFPYFAWPEVLMLMQQKDKTVKNIKRVKIFPPGKAIVPDKRMKHATALLPKFSFCFALIDCSV